MAEFDDFLAAYERGEATFVWSKRRSFDGKVDEIKISEKVQGGPLRGLEDFASRIPFLTTAYLTQNGTVAQGSFEHWNDRLGVRGEELDRHFKYCNFWFYFSDGKNGEIQVRLEEPGRPTERQIHTHKSALLAIVDFKDSTTPQDSKFTRAYLLDGPDIILAARLNEPKEEVKGEMMPYWESHFARVAKPLIMLANGFVPNKST